MTRIEANIQEARAQHCKMLPVYLSLILITTLRLFVSFQKQLLKFSFIALFAIAPLSHTAFAAEEEPSELDSILDKFQGLSCETDGIGNLLRTEFAHTCIPASFFTFVVANIISPGLYATAFLRLTINDDKMFPGACDRGNRIEFKDQKISFAMCNNIMLITERVKAVASSAIAIAKSVINNTDPWEEIGKAWKLDKADYHKIFRDKRENDSGTMVDIGIVPIIPWKVIKDNDKLCVATQSFSGWIPIGCKYIKEPYPVSIYADFMDLAPEGDGHLEKLTSLTSCGNMGGCYNRAYENSRTGVVITGPLIECVKEMIAKLMISSAVCSFDDVNLVLGSSSRRSSALFQFQVNMHRVVSALLTIYVILFGFKVVLSGNIPEKKDMVNFAVKFLFVVYFSVGININVGSENDLTRMDGMIQWAFPFMLDGMTQMASWIINASPSKLCRFDDVYYPDSLRHLQLWDALDCRISHYIGLDALQNMIVENATRHQDFSKFDGLSNSIPPYVFLLIPAVISGNMTLISLAIMYPLLIISVGAFVVNATVVCMISIVILGVLAPLFVPLYLFNYTKGYFDSWVRLLLSFMLQPMVAVVFMTTMLSVYDFGFYGTCKYKYEDITYNGPEFNIKISSTIGSFGFSPGADGRAIRYFSLDKDWGSGEYEDQDEIDGCINSLGFMLNSPFDFIYSTGQELATAAAMPWIEDGSGKEDKKRFDFLNANQESSGMFFKMIEVIFEKIRVIVMSLLTACLVLYLMYHFSSSLANFAADMTEGVALSGMTIKPQTLFKAGMAAAKIAAQAAKGDGGDQAKDQSSTDRPGATDKVSTGGGEAGDKVSTGGRGASDKISTGGGGSSGGAALAAAGGGAGGGASDKVSAGGGAKSGGGMSSAVKGLKKQVDKAASDGEGTSGKVAAAVKKGSGDEGAKE